MIFSPKIIAVDDDLKDLQTLTQGLLALGAQCTALQAAGGVLSEAKESFQGIRIVFMDINLVSGTTDDYKRNYGIITKILSKLITQKNGPYLLITWTNHPDRSNELEKYLKEEKTRIGASQLPVAVKPLRKPGNIDSPKNLQNELYTLLENSPQIAALIEWEHSIQNAAADTVYYLTELVRQNNNDASVKEKEQDIQQEIGRVLTLLANEAVGTPQVESSRFSAVNDALLPILHDRIIQHSEASGESDQTIWKNALSDKNEKPKKGEAAKLNRFYHIAFDETHLESHHRGAVIPLESLLRHAEPSDASNFGDLFGDKEFTVLSRQFLRNKKTDESQLGKWLIGQQAVETQEYRWVLVETRASCDHAQQNPGLLRYILGVEAPARFEEDKDFIRFDSLYITPAFFDDKEEKKLILNARYILGLPIHKIENITPLYRIREGLLSMILHHIAAYTSRPGVIAFRH